MDGDSVGAAFLLLATGAAVLGLYLLHAAIWPWRACRWCKGTGKSMALFGVSWRSCPTCTGSGKQLRVGAWAVRKMRERSRSGR